MNRSIKSLICAAGMAALFIALLTGGCGSGTASQAQVNTSVSVDSAAHRATIRISAEDDPCIIALFLTYPDGHSEKLLKGNVGHPAGHAGATLTTGELSQGEYTYTVYAIPQGSQDDPNSVSVDQIVENGRAVTGKFAIP